MSLSDIEITVYYARLKDYIFKIFIPVAFLAILFDSVLAGQKNQIFFINLINMIQLAVSYLLFFLKKLSIKKNFGIVIYFLISNIVLTNIIQIDASLSNAFFMRDIITIFLFMPLASIVIDKIHNLIIGIGIIFFYVTIYFLSRSDFLLKNFIWFIIVTGGYSVSIYLLLRMVETFLRKHNQLTKRIIAQNNELSVQAGNLTEINKLLSQQAIDIKNQQKELERLNLTKDKFFSLLAHDLKTPMNSIIGFSDLLDLSYDKLNDEKRKKYIEIIKSTSKNTFALLENLLEWSIAQKKNINCIPVKLNVFKMFDQINKLIEPAAKAKKINIVISKENDINVLADEHMLLTVLRNLVSNGIKYTPEQGTIKLISEKQENEVKISVSDTGIGLAENQLNSLFKIETAKSTKGTSGETGTGLGLIISNDFLIKHNSKLEVVSKPGMGTTFSFKLPIAL